MTNNDLYKFIEALTVNPSKKSCFKGRVISVTPFNIQVEGLQLDKNDVLISDHINTLILRSIPDDQGHVYDDCLKAGDEVFVITIDFKQFIILDRLVSAV